MYKAGHDKGYAEKLGGNEEFVEKASKYFSGTMTEARRLLEPIPNDDDEEGGDDKEEEEEEADDDEDSSDKN